ncbi:MAG: DNA polymerase III subunit delta' [Firmicutes bacterium]|nr:DNA polymerase III subunit delta' [Bacillota bacterium]MDD4694190.1 DNA polymerase III subunit delta' [Bacillota bacterium]
MFERVIGQENAKKILETSIKNDSICHAYLFSGPKGVGKTTMATELAMVLNCENKTGCGTCSSCRRISQGIFADVKMILPDGPSIKINEIRKLSNFIFMSSYEGKFKVGIIQDAEKMREEAANSLLKTLEEPPKNSIIILTAQNQYAVLPTILSRVQKINFHHLAARDIIDYLVEHKEATKEEATKIADYCGGSLGKAIELQSSEDIKVLFSMATKVIDGLCTFPAHQLLEIASTVGRERKQAARFLELLSDTLRLKSLKQEFSMVFGKQYSINQIASILDYIEELKLYIAGYGNSQLAMEGLFIRICRL